MDLNEEYKEEKKYLEIAELKEKTALKKAEEVLESVSRD